MTFEHILYSVQDSLATLILNRPDSANTLSMELIREVQEVLKDLSSREDVSALIIKGAGKHFSSGHLLKELVGGDPSYYRTVFTCCGNMMEALHALPMPVIASVRGAAFAAGCQLVATCDLVVAEEGARFATPRSQNRAVLHDSHDSFDALRGQEDRLGHAHDRPDSFSGGSASVRLGEPGDLQ